MRKYLTTGREFGVKEYLTTLGVGISAAAMALTASVAPAQAAEPSVVGEKVLVLAGATTSKGIKLQYRVDLKLVGKALVGVEQWRLCRDHTDACARNSSGGKGWIAKGKVVMAPMPGGTGYVGHSDVGQIWATFADDGTMKATYNLNLKRLQDRSKTTPRHGQWANYCDDPNYLEGCIASVAG